MTRAVIWAIGGSDSSGGAGIQADTRAIHGLGGHACTVVTAVTAQSSRGVSSVWPVSADALRAQLETLIDDMPPAIVKIGMLATEEQVRIIAEFVREKQLTVVLDPVMTASAGGTLLDEGGRRALIEHLVPAVSVLTPNLQEAGALLGSGEPRTSEEIEQAADELRRKGPATVIVKGGHGSGALARDYVLHGGGQFWLSSSRIETRHTHGTGCTFASAFATALQQTLSAADAAVVAKMYVRRAIRSGYEAGGGAGPVDQGSWPEDEEDLPWLTTTASEAEDRPRFPRQEHPLGVYAIVDSAEWIERLLGSGVGALQLRIKSLEGEALRNEIAAAIRMARDAGVPLFINDYWRDAIELGAYGVHLGQEDLQGADLHAIARAGLRLGISTHCYQEVARAHALRPSYMAIGPIFETKIKQMSFRPQGIAALRRWRSTLRSYPLVAIAGIDASNAAAVLDAGADSIAVIRAITQAPDPVAAARELATLVAESLRPTNDCLPGSVNTR